MRRAFKFSLWVVVLLAAVSVVLLTATWWLRYRTYAEVANAVFGSIR